MLRFNISSPPPPPPISFWVKKYHDFVLKLGRWPRKINSLHSLTVTDWLLKLSDGKYRSIYVRSFIKIRKIESAPNDLKMTLKT